MGNVTRNLIDRNEQEIDQTVRTISHIPDKEVTEKKKKVASMNVFVNNVICVKDVPLRFPCLKRDIFIAGLLYYSLLSNWLR